MEKEFTIYWVPRFKEWVHDAGLRVSQAYVDDQPTAVVIDTLFDFTGHSLPEWVIGELRNAPNSVEGESDTEFTFLYTE